jgi:hypothetical protein
MRASPESADSRTAPASRSMLLALAMGVTLGRAILGPMDRISSTAGNIVAGTLWQRIRMAESDDEFKVLAERLDAMPDRVRPTAFRYPVQALTRHRRGDCRGFWLGHSRIGAGSRAGTLRPSGELPSYAGQRFGLSLVKAVAGLHGAKVSPSDNRRGLIVSLRLPRDRLPVPSRKSDIPGHPGQ